MESDLVTQADANRGAVLHAQLLDLSFDTKKRFFLFGEILKEIRDNKLWLALGFDSFDSYFSDPELSFSKSSVYHAISLVEHFPDWKRMLPEPPVRKLIMIVPHLTEKNRDRLLEYASGQSSSDLRYTLDGLRDGVDVKAGHHSIPKAYRCNECGKVKGIYWEDLCKCGFTEGQIKTIRKLVEDRA